MTEKMRSQMQASETKFLQKIKGVSIFDKHCNTAIREFLDIESLLLQIKRSQLQWFGQVSRMPHERLPKQTLYAEVSWKRPVGRSETRWLDYIKVFSWNRLGLHPSKMQSMLMEQEVWRLNLELLPPQSSRKSR